MILTSVCIVTGPRLNSHHYDDHLVLPAISLNYMKHNLNENQVSHTARHAPLDRHKLLAVICPETSSYCDKRRHIIKILRETLATIDAAISVLKDSSICTGCLVKKFRAKVKPH